MDPSACGSARPALAAQVEAKEWIEIWLKVCAFAMPCAYRWIFVSAAFAGFTANEVIAELDAIAAQRAELDRVARGLAEWRPGLRRLARERRP